MDIVFTNNYTFPDTLKDCAEGAVVLFESAPSEPCLVIDTKDFMVKVFNLSKCEIRSYYDSVHVQVVEAKLYIKNLC